jgi:hypothetical protein
MVDTAFRGCFRCGDNLLHLNWILGEKESEEKYKLAL